VGGLLFVKSFEYSSYAEGMLVLSKDAHIRAGMNGFIRQVHVEAGQEVQQGDFLFQLENPEIRARRAIIEARLQELQAKFSQALNTDRLQAAIFKIDLQGLEIELADLQRQESELTIISGLTGRFAVQTPDSLGRYAEKGDVLGYIVDLSRVEAQVLVTQEQFEQINQSTRAIELRLASDPSRVIQGELIQAVPLAFNQLPNRLFGSQAGGRIAVDARDPAGLTTMEPVFQLDLHMAVDSDQDYLGQRLAVRFVHFRAPVASRMLDFLRGQLITRFGF
jgi:multidrug efflux pump subunit AcrA (membrane-fusion protein)